MEKMVQEKIRNQSVEALATRDRKRRTQKRGAGINGSNGFYWTKHTRSFDG